MYEVSRRLTANPFVYGSGDLQWVASDFRFRIYGAAEVVAPDYRDETITGFMLITGFTWDWYWILFPKWGEHDLTPRA